MTCVSPPELNDRELLTYLDDEADHQVVAHLEQCPHCRERARHLAHLQDRLTARLYRLTCPSPHELGEYHLGVMPDDQAAAVAQHLAECPHCAGEVAQLKDYLAGLAPSLELGPLERIKNQVKGRVRVLVARLVSGGPEGDPLGRSALAPAYAGIRGEGEGLYIYQADDVQIAIEIQDDAEQPGHKTILGLTMGPETSEGLAFLWRAEQRIAVVPVDKLGNFVIPALAPGSYELFLGGPEVEVHIQELQVGTH
jgi:hypothetical protein